MGEGASDRKRNTVNAGVIKALEDAGYPPEEIARAKARMEPEEDSHVRIVVEPENADAVRLFRQMQSQWRTTPFSFVANNKSRVIFARTGLDYGALAPIATALRIELSESTMDALRLLEAETLAIYVRRQEQQLQRS